MHEIIRNEYEVKNGKDEIFLQIEVTTADDVFSKAMWLTAKDVESVLADEAYIDTVSSKLANKATIERSKMLKDEEDAKVLELEKVKLEVAQAELLVINASK